MDNKKEIIINGKVFKQYDSIYYVSNDGDVYSMYSNKILKHNIDHLGYPRVDIHKKHMKVHRLVYMTWIGEIPEGMNVNHKDDNKLNISYTNLYYGTQKENIEDCKNNGKRIGHTYYLTVQDKVKNVILTFCPANKFMEYAGHTNINGSMKRVFRKQWFCQRYKVIEYKQIDNFNVMNSVSTRCDECSTGGNPLM